MKFAEFFKAVHGENKPDDFGPFPWQEQLAAQVAETGIWPAVIDLPTASGKTAVLDIAVWHLAQQAALSPEKRTAPRRIWFVVDRRIVVDEAYVRAGKIASWLSEHRNTDIAQALYEVSGLGGPDTSVPPLSYGRLRGGILQDSGWASFPSQPAILTSTVDQFGSRLLFRGYGMGSGMWPVHAALAGNDSLLVLDEAHLAEPLMQTLHWVRHYRDDADYDGAPSHDGPRWCEQKIALPWQMTVMSATPSPNEQHRFPGSRQEREAAMDHPLLQQRIQASKPARLVPVDKPKASKKRPATACAPEAADAARQFVADGRRRVAVMMNRVDAAIAVYEELSKRNDVDAVLLTGRMRPFDRDRLVKAWTPKDVVHPTENMGLTHWLGARPDPPELPKPVILVTTQCLEVGADLSFDALVTECASIDALRQRFGRLNRFGVQAWEPAPAVILAWHGDVADDAIDPIYGEALRNTWGWLNKPANEGVINFGIAALDAKLEGVDVKPVLPQRPDAPVLLPAYLDAWCQTGPRPHAEAAPALFLHGMVEEQAEVQVAFRHDLTEAHCDDWAAIVRLTPPVSGELLTVRLHRLRQWLYQESVAADSDVEGVGDDGEQKPTDDSPPDCWVCYRGQSEQTRTERKLEKIKPGDVLILPAGDRIPRALGHGEEASGVDVYEQAVFDSGRPQIFRLTPQRLDAWTDARRDVGASVVRAWLDTDDEALPDMDDWSEVRDALQELVPARLRESLGLLSDKTKRAPYPGHRGGVVLIGPRRNTDNTHTEADPFADDGDSRSLIGEPVSLADHSAQVALLVRKSARRCVPGFAEVLERAAELHDVGKSEPRFQGLLHQQPMPWLGDEPLAKSDAQPSPTDRLLRDKLGIAGFRHELLSMQRAAKQHGDDDLLLHLIASHHGHARPFAPVFADDLWTDPPPHHVGSGVAERFWKLTRRYGWWGLAYLEAVLRLADHHASRFPPRTRSGDSP